MLTRPGPLLLLVLIGCRNKELPETDTGEVVAPATDADADGYSVEDGDCDDADASVHPGTEEICDGTDNDCDGTVDEGVTSTFYADSDADGFGDAAAAAESCEPPSGHVATGTDCDDTDADSYPGAPERCDGEDNDCDGDIDEEVQGIWYADADDDGYGDPGSVLESCDPEPGYVADAADCDDTDSASFPGGEEVCDEADNDCDGDTDEGVTTTFYIDTDGDGFGVSDQTTEGCDVPTGYAVQSGDCDDTSDTVSPLGTELCDSIDNDCDGDTDEDDAADAETWYADSDGDGYGDASTTTDACTAPSGYLAVGVGEETDCDDSDGDINPDAEEVCDGVDQDCDSEIDEDASDAETWYADADGDGYGTDSYTAQGCDEPSGYTDNTEDCDDTDATVSPAGTEECDGIDNNCDGDTDEGVSETFYLDADTDGYGNPDRSWEGCEAPSGYVSDDTDCDDLDADSNPAATEVCDTEDNDCDTLIDDDDDSLDASTGSTWYPDDDGDGYGYGALHCQDLLEVGSTTDGIYTIYPFGDGTSLDVYCNMTDDDGGWMLLLHHDAQGNTTFFSSDADAGLKNDDDPEAELYSILDYTAYFENSDGTFEFMIEWPGDATYTGRNIWTQTSNPTTETITGYTAVDVDYTTQYWGGLEPSGTSTYIDGSVGHSNWFYSIGSQTSWSGGIPGPDSGAVDVVSLWVRVSDPENSEGVQACEQPSGYTDNAEDCDDSNASTSPDAAESCDGEDNDCDGTIDDGVQGTGSSCPAESCATILADDSTNTDGSYWLDIAGTAESYRCDMTTDGGGWTQVVGWDRESDGDDWTDFESELDEVYDNMTNKSEASTYIYWADYNSDADVLAYERPVPFANDGEIILDVHYYGYSMDNSAMFFYAETTTADEDILCKEDDDGGYSTTEYTYWPYTCADSADTTWTWDQEEQHDFTDEIEAFHLRSFHWDVDTGDYSYLYRLNVWIR